MHALLSFVDFQLSSKKGKKSGISSAKCQTAWNQIRPDVRFGLACVKTFAKDISRRQKSPLVEQNLSININQLLKASIDF